jgi:hypothetical protein
VCGRASVADIVGIGNAARERKQIGFAQRVGAVTSPGGTCLANRGPSLRRAHLLVTQTSATNL